MAALPPDRVYQGSWIDYTQGPILGATITTTNNKANLVIASLSLLVAFAGSHLWDLIAFTSYHMGVSPQCRPVFHHQRQAIARTITSPGAFALEAIKIGWRWRRHRPWSSLGLMIVLAFVCSFGFLAAGIFVSFAISNSDIKVLARSESCGFLSWRNETTDQHRKYQQMVLNQAFTYAEACYNKTGDLPQCDLFFQKNIPLQRSTDAECPFPGLCKTDTSLTLDTGLLDSDETFGINSPSHSRVQMQRMITCAPLDLNPFFTARPAPASVLNKFDNRDPLPGEFIYEWSIGSITADRRPYNSTIFMSNYTSRFCTNYDLTPRAFYATIPSDALEPWHNSTFSPLPIFRRRFADTHILGIQNDGVRYYKPNDDPLFSAHKVKHLLFDDNKNETMYTGDHPATFLGCTEQFRFCFSQGDCTELLGIDQAFYQAQKVAPTPEQNSTLQYLFHLTPTWYQITTAPLQVTKNAISFQLRASPVQWKIEMVAWMNYLLAITQSSITHLAGGPGIVGDETFDRLVEPLNMPSLCHSQRMGSPTGFSNINVFGLALVTIVSNIIIILNLTLVPTLKLMRRYHLRRFPIIAAWTEDGILQLQRKAYEGSGVTGWSFTGSDVPMILNNPSNLALSSSAG